MALRLIEMHRPNCDADANADAAAIPEILGDLDLVDRWDMTVSDDHQMWHILAQSDQVEAIVNALQDRFSDQPSLRLVVFGIEATIPRPDHDSDGSDSDGSESDGSESDDSDRPTPTNTAADTSSSSDADTDHQPPINIEELYEDLTHGMDVSFGYTALVGASAMVAAAGVYRNDLILLIGAMIIAPLLPPNMALAMATTMADVDLGKRALKVGLLGASVTVAIAFAVGMMLPFDPNPAETSLRTTIGLLDVAVAAAAGVAGALSFTGVQPAGVVGVMIAAALLPPLVSFGMLAGAGRTDMAVAPLILVLINVICINLAAVSTFFVQHIRPRARWDEKRARRAFRSALAIWVGLLVALIGLAYVAGPYWSWLL